MRSEIYNCTFKNTNKVSIITLYNQESDKYSHYSNILHFLFRNRSWDSRSLDFIRFTSSRYYSKQSDEIQV